MRNVRPAYVGPGSSAEMLRRSNDFRSAALSGHDRADLARPLGARSCHCDAQGAGQALPARVTRGARHADVFQLGQPRKIPPIGTS
jgi:hypothetical protein